MHSEALGLARICSWFFDLDFVRAMNDQACELSDDMLIATMLDPENHAPYAPNMLFDAAYCRSALGLRGDGENVVLRFLVEGMNRGVSPNPLFDPDFYLLHRPRLPQKPGAAIKDCLARLGRNETLSPFHPFLDEAFMRQQRDFGAPVDFYKRLFAGEISEKRAHPLVDFEYLSIELKIDFKTCGQVIAAYWDSSVDVSTHVLFDLDYYQSHIGKEFGIRRAAYHYLVSDAKQSPQPLFDVDYYAGAAEKVFGYSPVRPFEHYICHGQNAGIDPSPFFEAEHYRAHAECPGSALEHFLSGGYLAAPGHSLLQFSHSRLYAKASLHPDVATESLLARRSGAVPQEVMPVFDPVYWKNKSDDLASDADPALIRDHYLRFGYPENKSPNGLLNKAYISEQIAFLGDDNSAPINYYFRQGWHLRPRVLFAVDDLEDTAINRSLCVALRLQLGDPKLEVVIVARAGGALESKFRRFAQIWMLMSKTANGHDAHFRNNIARLRNGLGGNLPELAFIQADKNLFLLESLRDLSARNVLMSDTLALPFDKDGSTPLSETADHFLCRFITKNGRMHSPPSEVGVTFTQGYTLKVPAGGALSPGCGQGGGVRARLGISEDAFLVVGCGSLDLEDGIDIFGFINAKVTAIATDRMDICFVWVGDGPKYPHTPYFYGSYFSRLSGESKIFQTVNNIDILQALQEANAYLETSREVSDSATLSYARQMGLATVTARCAPVRRSPDEKNTTSETFDFVGAAAELLRLAETTENGETLDAAQLSEIGHAMNFLGELNTCARSVGQKEPFLSLLPFSPPNKVLVVAGVLAFEKLLPLDISPTRRHQRAPIRFFARQITRSNLTIGFKAALHVNGATEYCVKLLNADLTPADLGDFDTVIWILDGTETELADTYRLGNFAEEIWVADDQLIATMTQANPNIAARMRFHEGFKT